MRYLFCAIWWVVCGLQLNAQLPFEQSNLPIVIIHTNGLPIPDEPKITAQMGIIFDESGQPNQLTDPYNVYSGTIGIERRGSTSQDLSSKKPYAIELRTSAGEDTAVALLGMPAESDWVLLAPFSDKTMMRDALTYLWAGKMMQWASRARYCELFLNNEYQGVYILVEKIKRDANRVDISKLNPEDTSGDELTGGYILKVDKCTGLACDGFYSDFPFQGTNDLYPFYQYHYPGPGDITGEQQQYIAQWMHEFEEMLSGPDFDDSATGYSQWIDPATFVDFLLINELTKNVDGYRLSTFFYKDKDSEDPRLKMGPVWDFNIALGNADYCNAASPQGWALDFNQICPGDYWQIPFWWYRLINQSDSFRQQTQARWIALRQETLSTAQIMHDIDSIANLLTDAQERNFDLYPILDEYVWPNPYVGGSYEAEVGHLKNWLLERLEWMDTTMGSLSLGVFSQSEYYDPKVYPNPSNDYIIFDYYVRHNEKVTIDVYNTIGQKLVSLHVPSELNGQNTWHWYHHLTKGVYLYRLNVAGVPRGSGKMIISD